MFALRTIPVYLALGALALAAWTAFVPTATPVSGVGWALLGMLALYAASAVILRADRRVRTVAHVLDDAARLNAARVIPTRPGPSGEGR